MALLEMKVRTTVARANSPSMTPWGTAIAREQCRAADSQSWDSIADRRAASDDYIFFEYVSTTNSV